MSFFKSTGWRAFLALLVVCGAGFSVLDASAATDSQSVDVTIVVPSSGGGQTGNGGPPPPPPPPEGDKQPPVISNVQVTAQTTSAEARWTTNEPADSQVQYGPTVSYGGLARDASLATNHVLTLSNLLPNTTYHYRVVSTDAAGNSANTADATFKTAADSIAPPDVSNLTLVVSGATITLSWSNPSLAVVPDFSGVRVRRKSQSFPATPTDGASVYSGTGESVSDRDLAANTTYYYAVCSLDTSNNYSCGATVSGRTGNAPPPPAPRAEICDNGADDDGNGKTDCADSACSAFSGCAAPGPAPSFPPGTTPAGAGGGGAQVAGPGRVTFANLKLFAGNGKIELVPVEGVVTSLSGSPLMVTLRPPPGADITSVVLVIGAGEEHRLQYQAERERYEGTIVFPSPGDSLGSVAVNYRSGDADRLMFTWRGLPRGNVTADGEKLSGITVTLLQADGRRSPTEDWGQPNPFVTAANGAYGWVAPNGSYRVLLQGPGYYDRETPLLNIRNNVVNVNAVLIRRPPPLSEVIDPERPFTENLAAVAKNIGAKARGAIQRSRQAVADIKQSERAQNAAAWVAAPAAVGVAAVSLFSFLSFANLAPFLRLLFLEPLMLLGLKRRAKWGQVYNALNKLPVDLATVRLVGAATGRIVQTKVTDKRGRYAFVVSPGRYRLTVFKNQLVFPSQFLAGQREDGRRTDIYHGEVIEVTAQDAVITANIPLDPIGEVKPPPRLRWYRLGRFLQNLLAWIGFLVTLASLYIAPRWYVWALAVLHLGLFFLFRRWAAPPKVKSWGIVYDESTQAPLGRVVARLFNAKFDKLVGTQITDTRGRYYFLAGDDEYYVTYNRAAYAPHKTELINLKGKEADTIAKDIALKRPVSAAPSPQPPPSASPPPLPPAPVSPPPPTSPVDKAGDV